MLGIATSRVDSNAIRVNAKRVLLKAMWAVVVIRHSAWRAEMVDNAVSAP